MTITRTVLQPAGVPEVPYAQGIDVRDISRLVFVSGQIGTDDEGNWLDGVEAQTRQVITRVRAVLAEAGLTMEDVVKLTIYLTDPADYGPFMAVAGELMAKPTAAVTGLVVPFLSAPEQKVEIEAIAAG
jgi:2-iminobutanoate/2-iminopropanoate deaminase